MEESGLELIFNKEKTNSCSGCAFDSPLEHKLFHESGLSQGIIRELNLSSLDEIHKAFKNASFLSTRIISFMSKASFSKVFLTLNQR